MSYFLVFLLNIIVLFVLFTHLYYFKFIDSVVSSIVFSANCFKSPVRCETLPYCHSALSAIKGVKNNLYLKRVTPITMKYSP